MTQSQELDAMYGEYVEGLRDALKGMDAQVENAITERWLLSEDAKGQRIYQPTHVVTLVLYSPPPPATIKVCIYPSGDYAIDLTHDDRLKHPRFVFQDREIRQPLLEFKSVIESSLHKAKMRLQGERAASTEWGMSPESSQTSRSCFISHSAKDKRFCERLYDDLQSKGVSVWYFPEDAKWGEPVWGEIDRGIKRYDKLVVICSENSLQSGPVSREIERALNREDTEHKSILFPITLDRYVFDTWEHERKADVLRKVVGDFSGWDKDAVTYDKAFDKLLKGLQASSQI